MAKPKIFPDKPIPIRFPKSLRQRIDVVADRDGVSWAEAVRRLLEKGLEGENDQQKCSFGENCCRCSP